MVAFSPPGSIFCIIHLAEIVSALSFFFSVRGRRLPRQDKGYGMRQKVKKRSTSDAREDSEEEGLVGMVEFLETGRECVCLMNLME